jgi:hypothetical protein
MPIACAIAWPRAGRTSRPRRMARTAAAQNSRRARRGFVGGLRDDSICPASGCHAPRHRSNNAGRSTIDSIGQGSARTRNCRRARSPRSPTACYSIDAALGGIEPDPQLLAHSRNLRSTCGPASRRGPDRARLARPAAKCLTSIATRARASVSHMPQDAACPCTADDPSANAHAGAGHTRVCAQIHTRRAVTGCEQPSDPVRVSSRYDHS